MVFFSVYHKLNVSYGISYLPRVKYSAAQKFVNPTKNTKITLFNVKLYPNSQY